MSLSCKGDDHSVVEDIFQKELEILSTTGGVFYHGGFKRLIRVKLGKLLVCVDRPERTSLLQVGDHNGTYSSFWAHSCFVDGFCKENHLPSCEQCRKKRVEQIFGSCGADDVLPSSLGEINFTRDYIDTVDEMISPINLTSNFTKQSKEDMACSGMKCSSWDVLHPSFHVELHLLIQLLMTKAIALLGLQLDVVLVLNKETLTLS